MIFLVVLSILRQHHPHCCHRITAIFCILDAFHFISLLNYELGSCINNILVRKKKYLFTWRYLFSSKLSIPNNCLLFLFAVRTVAWRCSLIRSKPLRSWSRYVIIKMFENLTFFEGDFITRIIIENKRILASFTPNVLLKKLSSKCG